MALTKEVKEELAKAFGASANDTGSIKVQVALLTHNIKELTEHCKEHPHDFSTKRGLLKMVCRRRKFLKSIQNKDVKEYQSMIERLGLRK